LRPCVLLFSTALPIPSVTFLVVCPASKAVHVPFVLFFPSLFFFLSVVLLMSDGGGGPACRLVFLSVFVCAHSIRLLNYSAPRLWTDVPILLLVPPVLDDLRSGPLHPFYLSFFFSRHPQGGCVDPPSDTAFPEGSDSATGSL